MSKPEQFRLNTDYGSLKNDDTATVSVTVPGSMSLIDGTVYTATNTVTVGTVNASSRVRIASDKAGGTYYTGSVLIVTRTGTLPGPFGTDYNIIAYSTRISSSTIQVTALITNPYGDTLTTASGSETFSFELSTFLSPFV
jgi:hypothetical protein